MRQTIVTYAGKNSETGEAMFDMKLSVDDPTEGSWRAGESEMKSIAGFYGLPLDTELDGHQASVLLSTRDFSLAAAERTFPDMYGRALELAAVFGASFISQNPTLRASVHKFAREWFESPGRDDFEKAIERSADLDAVQAFIHDAVADMIDAGAVFTGLGKARRNQHYRS